METKNVLEELRGVIGPAAEWNPNQSVYEIYQAESARYPAITIEQEVALARLKDSDDANREEAREVLVGCNLKYALGAAKKRYSQLSAAISGSVSLDDMTQEAVLGLLTAVDKYSADVAAAGETRLCSYASRWIMQMLSAFLEQKTRMVRIPSEKIKDMTAVRTAMMTFDLTMHRTPLPEEIAELFADRFTAAEVRELMELLTHNITSMDLQVNGSGAGGEDGDSTVADFIADEDDTADEILVKNSQTEALAKIIRDLPEKDRLIVRGLYGLGGKRPMTYAEIAQVLFKKGYRNKEGKCLSKQAVWLAQQGILARMKTMVEEA